MKLAINDKAPYLDPKRFLGLRNDWDEFDTVYELDKSSRPYRVVGSLSGKRPRDGIYFFQVFRFPNTATDEQTRRVIDYAIRRFDSYGDKGCFCSVEDRCAFHTEGRWHKYFRKHDATSHLR